MMTYSFRVVSSEMYEEAGGALYATSTLNTYCFLKLFIFLRIHL